MTAGEIRAALEGIDDAADVLVRDPNMGVDFTIQSFEGGALVVDLAEEDPSASASAEG